MSSLSEQLLKAGLVTQEQLEKAVTKPKNKSHKQTTQKKPQTLNKKNSSRKKSSTKKELTDLEKFYKERERSERKEKQDAIRAKKEAARIKKETNAKINSLISNNLLNDESAAIRYNFVVGSTIKYLFVTEQQQEQLTKGELAITFMGGKRSLIPADIGKEVLKLNPNKIVIIHS